MPRTERVNNGYSCDGTTTKGEKIEIDQKAKMSEK